MNIQKLKVMVFRQFFHFFKFHPAENIVGRTPQLRTDKPFRTYPLQIFVKFKVNMCCLKAKTAST